MSYVQYIGQVLSIWRRVKMLSSILNVMKRMFR